MLNGHDTLGLMPTGGGKSITFQVPGMMFDSGVTIVITPLISLMKDQVDNLKRHRIKAVYFHSGMRASETHLAWEKIINGKARFVYIAPERLANDRFMLELRQIKVNLIVVDEAHCISQWGYDFRPSYLRIKSLRQLKPEVPVLALTATATPEVVEDICRQLDFRERNVFKKSFQRDNISYIVRPTETKIHEVLHILMRTSGSSIVYVRSRKRCREISEFLNSADLSSTYYHAGLDFQEKELRQNAWKSGDCRIIVATNAFGMGIDKPDVRVVIHYDLPPSLEEYYQEAGRAGRDELPSFAVLLVAKTDRAIMSRRISEAFPERQFIKKTYERICNFLHVSVGEGYDKISQFDLGKFCKTFKLQEGQCRSAMRLLTQAGYIQYIEDPDNRSRLKILCDREELYYLDDISANSEKVLAKTLRLYTGLFSDYVYIRESEIASQIQMSENDVYDAMLELSRKKVLSYIPHSSLPMIYFPTSREETSALIIGKDIYETRKGIMQGRADAILDFAYRSGDCRVRHMLAYFGEDKPSDCGKCDICRKNRSERKNNKDREIDKVQKITDVLGGAAGGMTLQMLQSRTGLRQSELAPALSFLCNEGFVSFRNGVYELLSD